MRLLLFKHLWEEIKWQRVWLLWMGNNLYLLFYCGLDGLDTHFLIKNIWRLSFIHLFYSCKRGITQHSWKLQKVNYNFRFWQVAASNMPANHLQEQLAPERTHLLPLQNSHLTSIWVLYLTNTLKWRIVKSSLLQFGCTSRKSSWH